MTLKDLHTIASSFVETPAMPVLFVGHGSPMNAIEENEFSKRWRTLGQKIPAPAAIVCISAHWETQGTFVTTAEHPQTIHDFYGFPRELYRQQYPAPGSIKLAEEIINKLPERHLVGDEQWGLDHGTWTILKYIYPDAKIPVIQISIDHHKTSEWHYELGKELSFLRTKGVLVVGSGNMIHNLRMMRVPYGDFNADYGFEWAYDINNLIKNRLSEGDFKSLANYQTLHKDIRLAVPTAEHYIPMLYALGMKAEEEKLQLFNDKVIAGSLSMTSFIIGE